MLDPHTLADLSTALAALQQRDDVDTCVSGALPALVAMAARGTRLDIDLNATAHTGVPVVIAYAPVPATAADVGLTHRQCQVATLVAAGLSNKDIARELDIALGTVKDHVHAILDRLQLQRRSQVANALTRQSSPAPAPERHPS